MSFKKYIKNKLKNVFDYLSEFSLPFVIALGPIDFWAIMFIGCLTLFVPKLVWSIPIYILFKSTKRRSLGKTKKTQPPKEMEQIVLLIQSNKLDSLTKAIESNPKILHCDYKKQTLLSWCKFYNNTKALMVVLKMIKKYPPEKAYAMAA
jgi:hypothetical protein